VYAVNTGVPHAVIFVEGLSFDIIPPARYIRYNEIFPEGINVNFAEIVDRNTIKIRTYERGVEDETLSCGTGSTAVAVIANKLGLADRKVEVLTRGGKLKIEIMDRRVFMTGKAARVADGYVNLEELNYEIS